MSSPCCTDNASLNEFSQTSLDNPNLSNQGNNHMIKPDMFTPSAYCTNSEVIKAIIVNCCSLRSSSRRARFYGLLQEHEPSIIVDCESHLDDSYLSSEIFPAGFNTEKIEQLMVEVYIWGL